MRFLILLLSLFSFSTTALAQDVCKAFIGSDLRSYNIRTDSAEYVRRVYDDYCRSDGRSSSASVGVGLDMVVKALPVSFTGSYGSSSEAISNFCRTYAATAQSSKNISTYESSVIDRAFRSFDDCVAITQAGVKVRHDIVNAAMANLFVAPGLTTKVSIKGIAASPNMVCTAVLPGGNAARPITGSTIVTLTAGNSLSMSCTRKARTGRDGSVHYDEGVVTLLTDIGSSGNYSIVMPRSTELPETLASHYGQQIDALRAEAASEKDAVQARLVKIGASQDSEDGGWQLFGGNANTWDASYICPAGYYVSGVRGIAHDGGGACYDCMSRVGVMCRPIVSQK